MKQPRPLWVAMALWAFACSSNSADPARSQATCTQQALEPCEIFHEDWDRCTAGWGTWEGQAVTTVTDSVMDWTPRSIWAETRTSIKTYVDGVLKRSCTDSGVSAASSAALFTGGGGTAGTLADFDDAFVC